MNMDYAPSSETQGWLSVCLISSEQFYIPWTFFCSHVYLLVISANLFLWWFCLTDVLLGELSPSELYPMVHKVANSC